MVAVCHVLLGVSRRGCTFMLSMVQYIIHLTLLRLGPDLSQGDEKLLGDIPMDHRAIERAFSLDNRTTILAVCPNLNCHFTYEPTFQDDSPIPIYPDTCNHLEFQGGKKCGTSLLKPRHVNGHTIHLPIKPFIAFSFKDWLGGLLSRSGFEEKMDNAWVPSTNSLTPSKEMRDIFDGEILRNFKGFDGQHFRTSGEGRYAFSLCVDYFNPLGNKQAGKKKSIGMISLVCLNLPPDMRYKPENMFLFGIIPGPNEPPLTCLNHYLRPLVDMLLEFWFTGIRFSRTCAYYYGRVVRCALICVVSDLPAARKINGFASIHHTQMCAMCHCTRQKHDSLNDSFVTLGTRRTNEEIRNSAQLYLDAVNEKERSEAVHNSGIRWSELLRLPYFDASCFVVVDAMHNLFLGLVHEHYDILGIQLNNNKGSTTPSIVINIPEESINELNQQERKSLNRLINMLEAPIKMELKSQAGYDVHFKRLSALHKAALKLLCALVNAPLKLDPEHANEGKLNKPDFIHAILAWVSIDTFLILNAYQIYIATNPNGNSPKFYQWSYSYR
jgi:Transposase family tnp2